MAEGHGGPVGERLSLCDRDGLLVPGAQAGRGEARAVPRTAHAVAWQDKARQGKTKSTVRTFTTKQTCQDSTQID